MSGVQRLASVKRVSFIERSRDDPLPPASTPAAAAQQSQRRSERSDTLSNLDAWLMQQLSIADCLEVSGDEEGAAKLKSDTLERYEVMKASHQQQHMDQERDATRSVTGPPKKNWGLQQAPPPHPPWCLRASSGCNLPLENPDARDFFRGIFGVESASAISVNHFQTGKIANHVEASRDDEIELVSDARRRLAAGARSVRVYES